MFLGLAGMCFLLYQRVSASFLILVQLFVLVALGLLIFSYIVPFLKTEKILNPRRIFQETKKKERLNFWVNGAFQILLLNAPIILYIYADAPEKSGYASLALKFSMAFLVPVQVFGAIIEPEIAGKFKAREFAKIRKQFYFLLIQNILIMIPIFIIFMLYAEPLIQFLVGEEYLPGVNIIKVIVAAFFISSLVGPVGVYLNLTGYARLMTGVTFISVLLLCVLSVFLLEAPVEAVFFSVFSSQFCILFLILLYLMHFSWPRMKFDND
jgi:O-antigen/teichoic acid export membrane protein